MHIITGMLLAGLAGLKKNGKANGRVQVPRFKTGPVQTVHALPGRLRLRVPSLVSDDAGRITLAQKLPMLQGVESVDVAPVTGSILIRYHDGEVEPELLFAAVVRLLGLDREMEAAPRPVLARELRSMGESLNRGVYEKTGGMIDFWTGMMIVLAGIGVHQMIRNPSRAFPAGFTLVWWGLNSLRKQR